jgi:hypothetical protein
LKQKLTNIYKKVIKNQKRIAKGKKLNFILG